MATRTAASQEPKLRRLARADLPEVVAIDAAGTGRSRRDYMERRLEAALREPALHLQFAAERAGSLAGYLLARKLEGEFGRTEPALRLEIIGVLPGEQGRGTGSKLLGMLESEARRLGVRELRTQAAWRNDAMLRFFGRTGFELGRSHVIDRELHGGRVAGDEQPWNPGEPHRDAAGFDYGVQAANDFEELARDRYDVRSLAPEDRADIARIDHRITGRDRSGYITRLVDEAMRDSAIRVSLAAHGGGSVVGFVMAKVDFGDFGRTEPVAVIDTIGVDPGFARAGIGKALLSQLFANLHALRVERVETVIAWDNLALLEFFRRAGFGPSERLAFVKRLSQGVP
jgi:ribosomal protein S18 acetylase RimI-like enzyme